MGVVFSRNRLRCCMNVGAIISTALAGSIVCMIFVLGYYSTTNNRILIITVGLIFSLIMIGGAVLFFLSIRFMKRLIIDNPERRVRFSSQLDILEISGYSDQSIYEEINDNLGHVYEEIRPRNTYSEVSVDRALNPDKEDPESKPGSSSNSEHDNTMVSSSELCQTHTADDGTSQFRRQKAFRKRGKITLEGGKNCETSEKSYPISFYYNTEVFEDDEGEEIVI